MIYESTIFFCTYC